MGKGQLPFEGLKYLEFAWAAVGPTTGQFFSQYGATVIHVESHTHIDIVRLSAPFRPGEEGGVNSGGQFTGYNTSKYGVTLNLNTERGREIAWRFIDWADVITESFTPALMARWGLDYESVRETRPDIIYFSTTQFGQTGPWSNFAGYGPNAVAASGIVELCGWPGRERIFPYGAYPDFTNPPIGASLIIAALDYRRRTGKGLHIDQSQVETCEHYTAPVLVDYFIYGNVASASGNRILNACPHGVSPCRGDDR